MEGEFKMDVSTPPQDRYHLVWMICLLLGIGLLFPFNVFITANDFWNELWPNFNFIFYIVMVYNYPGILALFFNMSYGPKLPLKLKVVTCLLVDIFVLAFIPIITSFDVPPIVSLVITFICVFLAGMFSAMLFGTILAFLSVFPPTYTNAIMSGNGVAGVIVGLARIITILAVPNKPQLSADLYFGVAVLVMVSCLVGFFYMLRLPFVQYYMQSVKVEVVNDEFSDGNVLEKDLKNVTEKTESSLLVDPEDGSSIPVHASWFEVWKKIWPRSLMVFFTFFLTLSLFPGFYVVLVPEAHGWDTDGNWYDWYGVLIVFDFQVFDLIGRTLPKLFIAFNSKNLWILVYARVIFFPLFYLCVQPAVIGWYMTFVLMAIFAITNGYAGTLCMMFGPEGLEENEKGSAGAIMSLSLNLGILVAGHFSILLLFLSDVQGPPTPSPSPYPSPSFPPLPSPSPSPFPELSPFPFF